MVGDTWERASGDESSGGTKRLSKNKVYRLADSLNIVGPILQKKFSKGPISFAGECSNLKKNLSKN